MQLAVPASSIAKQYTIGICTSGKDPYLPELLNHVGRLFSDSSYILKEVIIVASEPSSNVKNILEEVSQDARFRVIIEDKRRGKYDAINKIVRLCKTDYLVLVNGDALPLNDSIKALLNQLDSDQRLAAVSSIPLVRYDGGISSGIIALMWYVHNEALKLLSEKGENRHSCDELMAVRRNIMPILPPGTVNDGAYISCWSVAKGFRIGYSRSSYVLIRTPKRLGDVMMQRRRIIYGHIQVWRRLGIAPSTMESLILSRPLLAMKILSKVIRIEPRLLISLFPAIIEELISSLLALIDVSSGQERYSIWRRYED